MNGMLMFGVLTLWMTAEVVHGITCGNRECHPKAVCWNNRCVCAHGFVGLGDIYCSQPDEDTCYLINDPHLITFGHEKASVPIPCIHRIAEFSPSPGCSVSVHGKTQLFLSHLAYEVGAAVVVTVGSNALRLDIDGTSGVATFSLNRGDPRAVGNETQHVLVGDKMVQMGYRGIRGTMYWEITSADCRFTTIFRPPMATGAISEQVRAPGIVCAVKRRGAHYPSDFPFTLCATPKSKGAIGEYQAQNNLSTPDLAVVLSWLRSEVSQTPGSQCQASMDTFNSTCTSPELSTAAVTACGPIFSLRTLRCLSDSFDVMTFFTRCIRSICARDCRRCTKLDALTKVAKCSIPTLSEACDSCKVQRPGNTGRAKSNRTHGWYESEADGTKGKHETRTAFFTGTLKTDNVTAGKEHGEGGNKTDSRERDLAGNTLNYVTDLKSLTAPSDTGAPGVNSGHNYVVDSQGNYLVDGEGNYFVYVRRNNDAGLKGCNVNEDEESGTKDKRYKNSLESKKRNIAETGKCGRRVCAPGAVCVDSKWCRCDLPYTGVGHVKCHRDVKQEGHCGVMEQSCHYKIGSDPQVDLSPGTSTLKFNYRTFVITLDDSDGSFTVDAIDCAFNVVFRPPAGSGAVAEQRKTPGVACTVRRTASFQLGYPEALCAKPSCADNGLGVYRKYNGMDTGESAALLAWLKSGTPQTSGSDCEAAMELFKSVCDTQALSAQAVNACRTMFSSPTIRCITKEFDIVKLFTNCIIAICSQDHWKCIQLDSDVKQAHCIVPGLTAACLTISPVPIPS